MSTRRVDNQIYKPDFMGIRAPELFAVWEKEGWEEPVIENCYGEAAGTTVILSLNEKRQ